MKRKNILCLALAALLALGCAGCGAAGAVMERVEQVLGQAWTEARQVLEESGAAIPAPAPVTQAPALAQTPQPPAEAEALAPAEQPQSPAEAEAPQTAEVPAAPEATAEPEPLRPGKYKGADGSVLTVREDGACTYKTRVEMTVDGKTMGDTLTFHGTVDNGVFTFDKVTYYGMDITDMARQAGYSDPSQWEAAAAALYAK